MMSIEYEDRISAVNALRVLIVDDDRDQAEGLAELIETQGHRSAMACSLEEARARLADFDAQVALIDLRLGTESGFDLVQELRHSRPDVLCVIVTAYANLDNTVESLQHRVFDFLRKPFSPATLLGCLERCAERIRLRREKDEAERLLREREGLLNQVGKIAKIGGWEMDLVTRKAKWTQGVYNLVELDYGQPPPGPDEHLGYYLSEYQPLVAEAMRALVEENKPLEFEAQARTAKGNVIWCRALGRAEWKDGQCVRVYGTFQDITERKQAEEERKSHIHFLESLERIDRGIRTARDLDEMMANVLETTRTLFDADRAWLLYPCDPEADSFRVPIESTRPDYLGAGSRNLDIRMAPGFASDMRDALASENPVACTLGTDQPVCDETAGQFGVQAQMFMAVHPRVGKPWLFGMHQCSHVREWTDGEQRLFQEIGRRIGDGLSTMLSFRDLRESEEKLAAVLNKANDGILVADVETQRFYLANETICRMLGYTHEEMLNMTVHDIHPPKTVPYALEQFRKLAAGQIATSMEIPMKRKDGSVFHADLNAGSVVLRGIPYLIGVFRDITERKKAEGQLRKEQDFSRTLVEASPTFFVAIDAEGKTIMMNRSMLGAIGYRLEEVVGTDYLKTFVPETNHAILAKDIFPKIIREKKPTVNENRVLTRDGRELLVEWHGQPVLDAEGNLDYFFGVGIDITQRKQAEEEREQFVTTLESQKAELERFAYTVSHDLKSPLITIQGFLGMLREDLGEGNAKAAEHDMAQVNQAADKMGQLLGDVLELSRIGRLVNPSEHVSLADLAREAVQLVGGQIDKKKVRVEISPDLPVAFGDRVRLTEIFQNLIDNAVKYMGDQPNPKIEIGSRPDDGETICYVRDNGMGIPSRYFDKIFGLFDQLDAESEGSGIGLTLVKRIVETHGGRIWVESDGPGQGSAFFFSLPLDKKPNENGHG